MSTHKIFIIFLIILFTSVYSYADNREIRSINSDINRFTKKLTSDEKKVKSLSAQIRALESKVSEQTKKIYNTEKELERITQRQLDTKETQLRLVDDLKVQQLALTEQLQALYSAGQQSHLKLLLKQEDPSDIGRIIKYFELINNNRIDKINNIKATQAKIKDLDVTIQSDKTHLEALYETLKIEKITNFRMLTKRNKALKKANNNAAYKRKRLKLLKTRESRLQKRLAKIEQKKEKIRQAKKIVRRSRTKTEKIRNTRNKVVSSKKGKLVGGTQKFSNISFSRQRGKLPWPVKGRLLNKYGAKKNERRRWRGVLIESRSGTRVKAIAGGKVKFAEYFQGYGYLVIIQHNNGYSSLYGNNKSLFVRKGQKVRAGHVIAAVGNTGGYAKNALYFKLQKGKRAINPMKWLR